MIAHPEALFSTPTGKKLRESENFTKRVIAVIVDECHMIEQWRKEFWPAFNKIQTLRSFFQCPVVALSATLTTVMWKNLPAQLGLKGDVKTFKMSPDKPNIYFEVCSKPSNIDTDRCAESVYLNELKDLARDGALYPVTLCYMPIEWCADAQSHAANMPKLGRPSLYSSLYAVIFSLQDKDVIAHVTAELKKEDPQFRLIFCSSALGMGFDSPSITRVIHGKPPRNMPDILQQVGRAGRVGQPSLSRIHYNNNDIGRQVSGLTDDIREYCTGDGCLRLYILKAFGFENPLEKLSQYKCCSRCKSKCRCSPCKTLKPDEAENGNANEQTNDNEDWLENLTVDDLFG